MDSTTAIAGYAALVGTASLAWQIAHASRASRTRLEVEVRMGFLTFGPRLVDAVLITIFNRSDHAARVTSAGLHAQDGSGRIVNIVQAPQGGELPHVIPPHDSHLTWIERADLPPEIDIYEPLRAWARAASGERFDSPATTLMSRS